MRVQFVRGTICAIYQILARRHKFTYLTRCAKHRFVVYSSRAMARTACITPVQLCCIVRGRVGPKFTPSTLKLPWKGIPYSVAVTVQTPRAMTFDLEGLSCAPVAFSKQSIAWRMFANWVTNTDVMNTFTFPFFLKEILEKLRGTKQRQVLLKSWPWVVYVTTWQDLWKRWYCNWTTFKTAEYTYPPEDT